MKTAIQPWLTVIDADIAMEFYKKAFNAVETYRLNDPEGGRVIRLSISGAEFWISSSPNVNSETNSSLGGNNIRMILVVDDPDTLFEQALKWGAIEIFSISEDHGWRLGRLTDPFGLDWEIGHPL